MTDRAVLFDNAHDRPISLDCLRGSLFGKWLPSDGVARDVALGLNQPARFYVPLTAEEIDEIATSTLEGQAEALADLGFAADVVSAEDFLKIQQRRREIAEAAQRHDPNLLAGGVLIPEGFFLAGKVSYDDEEKGVKLEGLRPNCLFENHTVGVSSTLTRPEYGSAHGTVTLRVIHDGAGVAYLFRKDEGDHTFFKVAFGHGAVT